MTRRRARWNADGVRRLRHDLGVTQQALAEQLGVRQQTVSEWETGLYQPRGASARLLDLVAEHAALSSGFQIHETGIGIVDESVHNPGKGSEHGPDPRGGAPET